jgi:hypothetical protein
MTSSDIVIAGTGVAPSADREADRSDHRQQRNHP